MEAYEPNGNECERERQTNGYLSARQVAMIEEGLRSLGDFGELHLIVERGRLRFIVTQKSFDALRWVPGSMSE